jgi:ribosomal protein S3
MGQKVNPISLRLAKTNKNYNSLWYGELAYGEFLKKEILSKNYIEKLLTQIGETPGEIGILLHPKKGKILSPYLWVEMSRRLRSNRFRLKHITKRYFPHPSLLKRGSVKTLLLGGEQEKIGMFPLVFQKNFEHSFVEGSHPPAKLHFQSKKQIKDGKKGNPVVSRAIRDSFPAVPFPAVPFPFPAVPASLEMEQLELLEMEQLELLEMEQLEKLKPLEKEGEKKEFEFIGGAGHPDSAQYSNLFWKGFLVRLFLVSLQGRASSQENLSILDNKAVKVCKPAAKKDVKLSMCEKHLFAPFTLQKNRVFADPLFLYHVGTSLWERWRGGSYPLGGLHFQCKKQIKEKRGLQPFPFPAGNGKATAATSPDKRERVASSNQNLFVSLRDTTEKKQHHPVLVVSHIESFCEKICATPITLHLWRSFWDGGSATFLAKEIAYFLQKRVSFPKIRREIFREISENQGKIWNSIEGIRISCSGRSGGRSKKAQRGKSETFYWGRNSSSLFLSQVGFGKSTALTQLGAVGVKVWICYKSQTVSGKPN